MKPTFSKPNIKTAIRSAIVFFISILFWEIMLRIVIGTSGITFYPVLFLLAASVFISIFTGWFGKWANHTVTLIILVLLALYYGSQMVYFRIFGSVYSVTMAGMGADAITNFGWALAQTIEESIWWILLFTLPAVLYFLWLIARKPSFNPSNIWVHGTALVAAVLIWVLGTLALNIGGTGRYTAYDAYHNHHTNTDTATAKLGSLPTTIIESYASVFAQETDNSDSLISAGSAEGTFSFDDQLISNAASADAQPEHNEQTGSPETDTKEEEADKKTDTSPNIIKEIDFAKLATMTDNEDIIELCNYFATVEGTNRNEYTGLFEGYNLIYICAESFSPVAIHPDVTPTLYMLANNGIVSTDYFNSFINTTTNGEFAFSTGLWPDVSRVADQGSYAGSFSQSATNWMPYGLGHMFNAVGADTFAFHNYYGDYYNRRATHSNLGFTTCKFMDDGMTFTSEWPASDLELMQQTVDYYIDKDQFCAYYMTFSGHGPYSEKNYISTSNVARVKEILGEGTYSESVMHYLACSMELDAAMEYLLERLKEAGKYENTVIIMTSDHYPYHLHKAAYREISDSEHWAPFDLYESSCIMWCGAIKEPIINNVSFSNIDILPTVLNLFGMEYDSRLLAGRDIFSDTEHIATLYTKCFITEYVMLDTQHYQTIWRVDMDGVKESVQAQYLNHISEIVDARYAASLMIIDTDFYRFVWENSGLMPEGYVPPTSSDD